MQIKNLNCYLHFCKNKKERKLWFSSPLATVLNSFQICLITLILVLWISMENKSNKKDQQHFSNLDKWKVASFCVQMWLQEVLIFHKLTGSSNLTHLLILKSISTESGVQQEDTSRKEKPCFSYFKRKRDTWNT